MGISVLSALQIQGNETFVDVYSLKDSDKWGYMITHGEERRFRPIVSSNPIYESEDTALIEGEKLMTEIKDIDLDKYRQEILGLETSKLVQGIIEKSRDLG